MRSGSAVDTPTPRAKAWLVCVRVFSSVALAISLFLLWGSWSGERLPGCGVDSGCGTVLHSRWAYVIGIPVSLPALLFYATVLGVSMKLGRSTTLSAQFRAWSILIAAGVALITAALWFICLQLFVLGAICPFCMTAHGCALIIGILLLANVPGNETPPRGRPTTGKTSLLTARTAARAALGGAGAVALLAAGQIVLPPRTYEVASMVAKPRLVTGSQPSPAVPAGAAAATRQPLQAPLAHVEASSLSDSKPAAIEPISGQTTTTALRSVATQQTRSAAPAGQKTSRVLQLHGGAFDLDLNDLPLLGSAEAPHVMVHLFDYSCRHCREMHPLLLEAFHQLSNELAIVSLPVPLATNCNRLVKVPIPDHVNACAYAYTGLAVWRANRAKLPEFEDWLFKPLRPPPPVVVEAQAMQLVGTNEFKKALADPWIKAQLDLSIRLYETNKVWYRRSGLPELIIGTNIVSGPLRNIGNLYQLFATQFGLQPPSATNPVR